MRVFTLQQKQVRGGADEFHLDLPQYFKSQDGTGTRKRTKLATISTFSIKIIILQLNFLQLFERIESRLNFCLFVECSFLPESRDP